MLAIGLSWYECSTLSDMLPSSDVLWQAAGSTSHSSRLYHYFDCNGVEWYITPPNIIVSEADEFYAV